MQRARALAAIVAILAAAGRAPAADTVRDGAARPAAVAGASSPAFSWSLPRGFPVPAVPDDNPMSWEKVALGERLFFDPALSVTHRYRCASCHEPSRAFTDGRPRAVGATGGELPRAAMSLANVAYNSSYGWMGREITSLEAQMRTPLFNQHPIELGLAGHEAELLAALRADAGYASAFERAFPAADEPVTLANLIRAIAAYERTLISGGSPFDLYVFRGEHDALDEPARRGMALFYSRRLGCGGCHAGFNFTGTWTERGRPVAPPAFARNGVSDKATRVPTLRNIALTAPYMHDGRYATLEQVIAHYERGGGGHRFQLSIAERADLISFLEALTDREFLARAPYHVTQALPP